MALATPKPSPRHKVLYLHIKIPKRWSDHILTNIDQQRTNQKTKGVHATSKRDTCKDYKNYTKEKLKVNLWWLVETP